MEVHAVGLPSILQNLKSRQQLLAGSSLRPSSKIKSSISQQKKWLLKFTFSDKISEIVLRTEASSSHNITCIEESSTDALTVLTEDKDRECNPEHAPSAFSMAESSRTHRYGSRRFLFGITLAAAAMIQSNPALAVKQTLLAGRIPGLSSPDENGLRTYRRPDEKSGGHGVGWSPIIPYSFKVPDEWEEVPVSIADLGGTEIDLRFTSLQEGSMSVIVAPVLRFSNGLGDNAKIEDIGTPEKVIAAFGPEITGENVEDKVKDMKIKEYHGRLYYQYELEPHTLISATAAGNRLYILSVSANGRQWKKHALDLKLIQDSFRVG